MDASAAAHAERPYLWWHGWWAGVFVANLPLPALGGWLATDRPGEFGQLGMLAAVVLVWLLGHAALYRSGNFAAVLLPGSMCTALLQPFFFLHLFAGMFALGAAKRVTDAPVTVGFLATLFTAAQLLAVALLCGWMLRGAWRAAEGRIDRGRY